MRRILIHMADDWGEDATRRAKAALINTTVPNAARVADYMYGGQNNFEADRKAARTLAATAPVIADIAPAARAFQQRVLRFLVTEAGIRQFLDIGTGLPLVGNTHEVAQRLAPDSRIVYVDNDPLVLTHARALLTSTPQGACAYIHADLHQPLGILSSAAATLDFSQPVAIILLGVLGHIADDDEVQAIMRQLLAGVPTGSYLALGDSVAVGEGHIRASKRYEETGAVPYRLRQPEQIAACFERLVLVEPGLVLPARWRPELSQAELVSVETALAGIGRKG